MDKRAIAQFLFLPNQAKTLRQALLRGLGKSFFLAVVMTATLLLLLPRFSVADVEIIPYEDPQEKSLQRLEDLYEVNNCAANPWDVNAVPYPTRVLYFKESPDDAQIGTGDVVEAARAQVYDGEDRGLNVLAWCP